MNKIIRGSLYTIGIALSAYLIFSVLEYYFYFPPAIRKALLIIWLAATFVMLVVWILLPLLSYLKLGRTIDYFTASKIIGTHFSEVEDKLLNILQLNEQADNSQQRDLIEASILQKTEALKPIPIQNAINLGGNKKYLRYALPPVIVLLFLIMAAPNVLVDSNYRYLNNNKWFEREAPFRFKIENDELEVVQYNNFTVDVSVGGNAIPAEVKIQTPAGEYAMKPEGKGKFSYTFQTVPSDVDFEFTANGFTSSTYELTVIPKPVMQQFAVQLNYPAYTGLKDEKLLNTGDLTIPEGTTINWDFDTKHTTKVQMQINDTILSSIRNGKNNFQFETKADKSTGYTIQIEGERKNITDSLGYSLQVVKDAYPSISIEQAADSINDRQLYFAGEASDDYGITRANFTYIIQEGAKQTRRNETVQLNTKGKTSSTFTYAFNIKELGLEPGQQLNYYFEVWDNDGINGSKSSRSRVMQYRVPEIEELKEIRDAGNDKVKSELEEALQEIRDIREETDKLEEKLLQKKELDWKDRKNIENLLSQQQQTREKIEDLKEQFKENLELEQEYLKPDEEILKKQEQLEKLFEEVLDEEMKQLFDELQKLLEQLNKEESLEEMEEMDLNNEQLEQELDRMLELFKQLQMEEKMKETIDELEKLAEEQEELKEETLDKETNNQENLEKQEEINEKFEEISKDLEDIREMNEELEDSKELGDTEKREEEVKEKLENSKEELQNNKRKPAAEEQQDAAQKMKQMAQEMQEQMEQQQMEQQQEDMQALQRLLDNLIKLSVDQEDLIYAFRSTKNTNPKYVDLMEDQQRIKEDTKLVEDSLIALSKRITQISSFITREVREVNKNLEGSLDALHERSTDKANVSQQFTMTGYNNLALMLDEVMQQMQQQMAQSMPGSQMCQKPGGESQLPSMGEMQKKLNEQLQQLKGQMSQGPKPGERQGMSQQLAEMARKQAAMREALQKMSEELGGGNTQEGELAKQLKEIADQMDKTEEDIVNKRLTEATLNRQEEILTRLLEAADAERERKKDKKRESNSAEEILREMPPALEEYLKKRNAELDLYKTVPPDLKPFYKNLVEEYFRSISYE